MYLIFSSNTSTKNPKLESCHIDLESVKSAIKENDPSNEYTVYNISQFKINLDPILSDVGPNLKTSINVSFPMPNNGLQNQNEYVSTFPIPQPLDYILKK